MLEPSGPAWCSRFPGSSRIEDLVEPFRAGVAAFVQSLRDAGAGVSIAATWRPKERAYLMHWACWIAGFRQADIFHQVDPREVPPLDGVDIDWKHNGDTGAARAAAVAMRDKFGIVFPAALSSQHTKRQAIDMTISWRGVIEVQDSRGVSHRCAEQAHLWPIGASFGVKKLASDPPHWSIDGH